jgi:predicted ATPase
LKVFDLIGQIAELDLAPALDSFGGIDGLVFQNAKRSFIQLEIAGTITKLAHSRALDEYSLTLRPVQFHSQAVRRREAVLRDEQFKFKRVEGPGRRITLSGSDLKLYNRSTKEQIGSERVSEDTSGLSLLRKLGRRYDAEQIDEIATLFESLRLVDIDVSKVRAPSVRDKADFIGASGANVAAFLLRLADEEPSAFAAIQDDMRAVLPTFERFIIDQVGGGDRYVMISIKERNFEDAIPLARASFGTLRAMALFAMLNDPNPPSLTCIEEIDHGFHPQALDRLVDRLRDATERTQIVLATHSPAFVNRLEADELVLFRRSEETGGTIVSKPSPSFVRKAKKEYGYELGELWFSGLLDD